MRFKPAILLVFSVLILSCEEKFDWDTVPQNNNLLVVDAVLTNEKTNHLVKLSLTNMESNQGWNPASGATVAITEGSEITLLTEFPQGSGLYFTPNDFRALFNKRYFLYIDFQGKIYTASDQSVPGEPFNDEPVYLEKENTDGLNELNFSSSFSPTMTRHFLTWAHTDYCESETGEEELCSAKVVQYDLKTIDLNENFRPDKENVLFPDSTIIIRKKYSMSEPYRQFLRAMLSETEWRGGYFDVQRGNVVTNLSEGALGFFAVSTVVTDTTLVQ